jgi:hypothetical protein
MFRDLTEDKIVEERTAFGLRGIAGSAKERFIFSKIGLPRIFWHSRCGCHVCPISASGVVAKVICRSRCSDRWRIKRC